MLKLISKLHSLPPVITEGYRLWALALFAVKKNLISSLFLLFCHLMFFFLSSFFPPCCSFLFNLPGSFPKINFLFIHTLFFSLSCWYVQNILRNLLSFLRLTPLTNFIFLTHSAKEPKYHLFPC